MSEERHYVSRLLEIERLRDRVKGLEAEVEQLRQYSVEGLPLDCALHHRRGDTNSWVVREFTESAAYGQTPADAITTRLAHETEDFKGEDDE